MGRIVSNFFISLDGVVESPDQWHFPYFNEEMGAVIGRGMESCTAFLLGRVLYQEWSEYWPAQAEDDEFAGFINNIPKYVVSSSLSGVPEWNNTTLVSGDVAAQLEQLKKSTSGDITMSGSATLVRWLLANKLLDELNLLMHPIVVGKGQRLFEGTSTHPLRLVRNDTLETGVLSLTYATDE